MKNKFSIPFLGLLTMIFFTCKSDDTPSETTNPDLTLDQIVAKVTDNGSSKTWKISSATLTNSSVNGLDVTNAFNIKDDEFRFSQENNVLQLEHRQRHDFNKNASDYQSFLLEAYKSALNYTLINNADTPTEINATDNALKFSYQNDDLITGEWTLDANTKLNFDLTVKTAADYPTVPTSLNFEEVATIPNNFDFNSNLGSASILGSQSNNNLYFVYKTNDFNNPEPNGIDIAEAILQYNIASNQFNLNLFFHNDLTTRRAWINNNQLKVIGTRYINTYDNLEALGQPISNIHYNNEIDYTRFGVFMNDNLVHIVGGSFTNDSSAPNYFNKIQSLNEATQVTTDIALIPTSKCQAASEIADGKVYIFGGQDRFGSGASGETLSYIYDLNSNTFTEFNLPQALNVSFAKTVENLIYVGGQIFVLNESNVVIDTNAYLGVYNTEDNSFTEITHNLDDSDTWSRIHGITHLNNELYLVYGNNSNGAKIYKATL